ncbi:MAG TPA: cytochrome P450 [Noviherbaspirillum sp.]|uniref:cytochrome P450 n=1 Tax=Noviherbaspirillum sp. TaxID=1926288 RepID=UPI002B48E0A8|nr:cytochrome P450 [Noviherbaspirillum sp.]HJV84503.1 cytochrome P450 [Noviherbaspirillum sp.]
MDKKPNPNPDWDPRSEAVLKDQIAAYDDMRHRCPVAHSEYLNWSLFRHEDVMRALLDHQTFSSAVSSHPSVPNGMDPPQHTLYRRIIEPYFNAERMREFEPACRAIAAQLVDGLPESGETELMSALAEDYALQVQSAYLGWPSDLHEPLRRWTRKNHEATLARDREAMEEVAFEFDGYIRELLAVRCTAGASAPADLTTSLLRERVGERLLNDEEIVSILRNWTVGELSTISASVGILAHYLASHPALQQQLREDTSLLPAAIDEILRLHAPLISNRRITTQPVDIGGRKLDAGERITLLWASANRDESVFGDPDAFRLDRDPSKNLLYGAGIHVCPGAPLARLELRVLVEEFLCRVRRITTVPGKEPVNAVYPAGGFASLPLWIDRAGVECNAAASGG